MSSTSGSWMAAADSIAAVEALKDQELCRWNHTIDSIHQRVKNNLSSISQAKKKLSRDNKAREAEALRKVMYLSSSIAAVEALKDQGFCRWNYPIRFLHQQAKNNLRSVSQAKKFSSSSSALVSTMVRSEDKAKQSEESLRKVMFLSCWGPN
ncbi:hypothetical protein EZV62_020509 [Acer yangbiense]|uniref:Uncharacterized protein n=1 Tax=Acer yangbiense TaxID=1000413 RepID=A0A5C7HDM4_9ROSI|nr:hypothetical protein EZV62_020509 [Acer yangbiense]